MAANELAIANKAVSRVGQGELLTSSDGTIANVIETGVIKDQLVLWYGDSRDELLRIGPWRFARSYATLTLADDGDGEVWEDEWTNAYSLPADYLQMRRFVDGFGGGWWGTPYSFPRNPYPALTPHNTVPRYVIREHDSATVILCNLDAADAKVEYTAQVTDTTRFPVSFEHALVHLLASRLAPALGVSQGLEEKELRLFQSWLRLAKALDFNEETPYPHGRFSISASRGSD